MAAITLYHNPQCSKSRGAKEILDRAGVQYELVEYLLHPLSEAQLLHLIELLQISPPDLVRRDSKFGALGLQIDDFETPEAVAELLAKHPELMQRPIAVRGTQAVLARPSERVEEILEGYNR